MKDINIDDFVDNRMKKNQRLFTKEEIEFIKKHKNCIKKIYLLGFIDGKECYEE